MLTNSFAKCEKTSQVLVYSAHVPFFDIEAVIEIYTQNGPGGKRWKVSIRRRKKVLKQNLKINAKYADLGCACGLEITRLRCDVTRTPCIQTSAAVY